MKKEYLKAISLISAYANNKSEEQFDKAFEAINKLDESDETKSLLVILLSNIMSLAHG